MDSECGARRQGGLEDVSTKRAVILAHHDVEGVIDPYVIEAATVYRRLADVLVLVSASAPALPPQLRDVVDRFISRRNVGYDFGCWKAGWDALSPREGFDEILFINDSVYGPLFDAAWMGDETACGDAGFWGMVLSEARAPHVQSWFMAARRTVIEFPGFSDFWAAVGADMPKEEIIRRQEIGLSTRLTQQAFSVAAVYDGRTTPFPTSRERWEHVAISRPGRTFRFLRKTAPWRHPFDPSLLFYKRLWHAGVPYIKRRLLDVNPYALDLDRVGADLRHLSPRWHALICQHQDRLACHRSRGR